ncbi:MAG: rRNA pseudouridine synthase [Lachnospiraceae bacterium]|nr:rRNA pseudouridine synthase [Lachnospiraceae bacterium]
MGKMIRLDKFLADMGKGSRSQIREGAKKGRVEVNGQTEKKPERKIDPDRDEVAWDKVVVEYRMLEYFMLCKPQGVVSATEDKRYPTVVELLKGEGRKDLFPVGRLDLDTEGLLILTNDGELAHQLLSPKKHVDKTYYARVAGILPKDAKEKIASGMTLGDGTLVQPGKLEIAGEKTLALPGEFAMAEDGMQGETEVYLTIQEGKFHQVKRMFEALGCKVTYLKRISMGTLTLDESLCPGEYRRLTEEELAGLKGNGEIRGL